jgi:hypothetical protein
MMIDDILQNVLGSNLPDSDKIEITREKLLVLREKLVSVCSTLNSPLLAKDLIGENNG